MKALLVRCSCLLGSGEIPEPLLPQFPPLKDGDSYKVVCQCVAWLGDLQVPCERMLLRGAGLAHGHPYTEGTIAVTCL